MGQKNAKAPPKKEENKKPGPTKEGISSIFFCFIWCLYRNINSYFRSSENLQFLSSDLANFVQ